MRTGAPHDGRRVFVDGGGDRVRSDRRGGATRCPACPARGNADLKMAGYRLGEIPIDDEMTKDVALEPFEARALYAPGGRLRGSRPAGRTARPHRPHRGQRDGHRRQGDRRLAVLRDRTCRRRQESGADRRPIFELERAAAAAEGARHLHHRPHGGHEGQHGRRGAPGAGRAQLRHGRALDGLRRRHLARPLQPRRGRVHRGHRRRPRGQGLRRGPAGLRPLLQRRRLRGRRHEPAQHAVLPAAGHPAALPRRLRRAGYRSARSCRPMSSRSASSRRTTRASASGRR